MNDQELDALVADACTPPPGQVESLLLGGPAIELRELIMTTAQQGTDHDTEEFEGSAQGSRHMQRRGRPDRPRRLRRRVLIVAVAAAAASAVTVGVVNAPDGDSPSVSSPNSAYADEIVAVARAAPRLLVTAAGWHAVRADEFGTETGEISFSDGRETLELFWRPAETHQSYLDDRAASADPPSAITVAGHEGSLFRYTDSDVFTAMWLDGDNSVEFRGEPMSESQFRDLAAMLQPVDIETWLGAMPESVVAPTDRDAAINDMLTGIPLPPGFDPSTLVSDGVSERYTLGAEVTGAVACGWIELWLTGDNTGDQATKDQATQAMATSRTWPILLEMQAEGGWTGVLWEYADDLANDGVSRVYGNDPIRSGDYVEGLGCSS